MTAKIIDGVAIAKKLRQTIAETVATKKLKPGLAVVLVGENPASQVYVRNKGRAAEEVGMVSATHLLPADTTQEQLLAMIHKLNADKAVHGILVQLPLPRQIDAQAVIAAIDPAKDVDGFHPINAGKLSLGLPSFVPCTPQGCMILIRETERDLAGKKALVLGRSNIVGKPVAQLLLQADCTVTIAHSRTRKLPDECRAADILIAAIGKPEFVRGDWVKPGAAVIDVGINRIDDPVPQPRQNKADRRCRLCGRIGTGRRHYARTRRSWADDHSLFAWQYFAKRNKRGRIPMITAYARKDGRITAISLSKGQPLPPDTLWLDLLNPENNERGFVSSALGIELPTISDMQEIETSSRLYAEGNTDLLTIDVVIRSDTPEPELDVLLIAFTLRRVLSRCAMRRCMRLRLSSVALRSGRIFSRQSKMGYWPYSMPLPIASPISSKL